MDQADWAAVELTPTELRLWLFHNSDPGASMTAPASGDPVATLRTMLHPLLASGASIQAVAAGWPGTAPVRVPCVPPKPLPALAMGPQIALHRIPGLMQDRPADLVGSATVRIAGYLASDPGFDGVLCLPGPQTVWAHISAGEIVSFRSFLTVEMLSALIALSDMAPTEGMFVKAVEDALSRPAALAANLSSARAQLVMDVISSAAAQAQMAGLLIGAELAAARPWWLGQPVTIIGDGWLAERYAEALASQGATPTAADPTRATLEGFRAARGAL